MYHRVLYRAFCSLHGVNKSTPMNAPLEDDIVLTSEFSQVDDAQEIYRKALRVKTSRTMHWLDDPASLPKLLLSTLAVTPMEHIMFRFMQWQKLDKYLEKSNPTLALMAYSSTSPAQKGIMTYCSQMTSGLLYPEESDSISLYEVAASFLIKLQVVC